MAEYAIRCYHHKNALYYTDFKLVKNRWKWYLEVEIMESPESLVKLVWSASERLEQYLAAQHLCELVGDAVGACAEQHVADALDRRL